jgi:tungstate transport system ATP-binding protein
MKPVISIKDVLVRQGEDFTLSIESLDLQPRRIYALTGPNGAGKSTLLRTMALLTLPEKGRIRVADTGSATLAQQRQKVTLVEQSPYLLTGTVSDNLAFGLKLRGIRGSEQKRRILYALALVGLEGFESRKACKLSGGELQRVALARALVLEPEVLLLDEPTSNVDSKSLQAFEELLRKLPDHGVTVVLSTHDLLLAERLGGEMLRIENGCLVHRSERSSEQHSAREKKAWLKLLNAQGH